MIAVVKIGNTRVELIQYNDLSAGSYHKNPLIAGSAHIALKVADIEGMRARLGATGVEFHSPINVFQEEVKPDWKCCHFRDPDGIVLELVEQPD